MKFNLKKTLGFWGAQLGLISSLFLYQAEALAQMAPSKKEVQQAIIDLKLNKSQSLKQFYSTNKALYPERVQKMADVLVQSFGDKALPQVDVQELKKSNGDTYIQIQFKSQNEISTVKFYGESQNYLEIDGIKISENDFINFDMMYERLFQGSEKIRQQLGAGNYHKEKIKQAQAQQQALKMKSYGYPTLDRKALKKMTLRDYAIYLANARYLWEASREVLNEHDLILQKLNSKNKTSKVEKYDFYKFILDSIQSQAWAEEDSEVEDQNSGSGTASRSGVAPTAENYVRGGGIAFTDKDTGFVGNDAECVVAGYVSKYITTGTKKNRKRVCSINHISAMYNTASINPNIKKVMENCRAQNMIACNPLVYGRGSDQRGICVSTRDSSFQTATHHMGVCDRAAPLAPPVTNISSNDPDRFNKIKEEQRKNLNPEYFNNLENMLKSMIETTQGKEVDFSKALDNDTLVQINKLVDVFNKEIEKSAALCRSVNPRIKQEINFKKACDQLHQRHLFIKEFLEKRPGCQNGGSIDDETLKCSCPTGQAVLPGASCEVPAPVTPTPVPVTPVSGPVTTPDPSVDQCKALGCEAKGQKCVEDVKSGNTTTYKCVSTTPPAKEGFFSKAWKFVKKWHWVVTIPLITYGVVKALAPKKPKLNGAGDLCPNGVTPPCTNSCSSVNKNFVIKSDGSCGCPSCPGSQVITDQNACTCGSSSTQLFLCSDGKTSVIDSNNCPIKCSDGSFAPSSIACPPDASSKIKVPAVKVNQ